MSDQHDADAPRRLPGTRVEAEIHHHREVADRDVLAVETVWNDTHLRSFDIYVDGECLTEEGSLDEMPSSGQLAQMLR